MSAPLHDADPILERPRPEPSEATPASAPAEAGSTAPVKEREILSVAELDRRLRMLLERRTDGVSVEGEVSGLREVGSGHAYFTLRDEAEDACIDCVMYKSAASRVRKHLAEGARLVLVGRVTFYAPRGRVQLVVESVRGAGRGSLLVAIEKRKQKLAAEGLFDASRKRPLPTEPRAIGVVTSRDGAVLHDIVQVAARRARVRIVLSPAPVQGPEAAERLAEALRLVARHPEVDVVILARGGGSVEDLAAFNEELLVRAVAASPVPVVTAVGHEVDVTLVDLAADVRASTPSQAAELVVVDARARLAELMRLRRELEQAARRSLDAPGERLDDLRERLADATRAALATRRERLTRLERRLSARHPTSVLRDAQQRIARLSTRADRAMQRRVVSETARLAPLPPRLREAMVAQLSMRRLVLAGAAARLHALSPLGVLARGYAIVEDEQRRVLRRASAAAPGERVVVRLAEGRLRARIEEVLEDGEVAGPGAREP